MTKQSAFETNHVQNDKRGHQYLRHVIRRLALVYGIDQRIVLFLLVSSSLVLLAWLLVFALILHVSALSILVLFVVLIANSSLLFCWYLFPKR